jgi:REP element-mobilizing transposase RayT
MIGWPFAFLPVTDNMKTIREKHHRLPRGSYSGRVAVGFTLCLEEPRPFFVVRSVVHTFIGHLGRAASDCRVNCVFCFMPEHVHTVVIGREDDSDALRSTELFKQYSGWWLKSNRPDIEWQKGFYDRLVRSDKNLARLILYTIDNPVRRGLVSNWRDYPFTGSIGVNLEQLLIDLMRL